MVPDLGEDWTDGGIKREDMARGCLQMKLNGFTPLYSLVGLVQCIFKSAERLLSNWLMSVKGRY